MKLKLVFILSLLFFFFNLNAQVFQWDSSPYSCNSVDDNLDQDGNTYALERVEKEDFEEEVFLVKYNSAGQEEWKISTPAYMYEMIEVDPAGNIYFVCAKEYVSHPYFAKFDTNGNLIWADSSTTELVDGYPDFTVLSDIKVDKKGNLFVTGGITGSLLIQDQLFKNLADEEYNMYESFFLLKFNSDGVLEWGIVPDSKSGDEELNRGIGLFSDDELNVYAFGVLNGRTTFGNTTILPDYTYTNFLNFILKADSLGKIEWITSYPEGNNSVENCLHNGILYLNATQHYSSYQYDNYQQLYARITQPEVPEIMYRVNSGGPVILDSLMDWSSDTQHYPSVFLDDISSNHTTGTFYAWNKINNTGAPKDIFGPNRYQIHWSNSLAYHFPVESGVYLVNLYFSEKPSTGVTTGGRVFDVIVEDQVALEAFDIFASAGLNAVKKSFVLFVSDNSIDISFERIIGNPQVNGIEIISYDKATNDPMHIITNTYSDSKRALFTVVNPVQEDITVKVPASSNENFQILLFDNTGAILFDQVKTSENGMLKIESSELTGDFSPGFYILKVDGNTFKLIKN